MPKDSRCHCGRCKEKLAAYQRTYYWGHPAYRERTKERLRKKSPPNTPKSLPDA